LIRKRTSPRREGLSSANPAQLRGGRGEIARGTSIVLLSRIPEMRGWNGVTYIRRVGRNGPFVEEEKGRIMYHNKGCEKHKRKRSGTRGGYFPWPSIILQGSGERLKAWPNFKRRDKIEGKCPAGSENILLSKLKYEQQHCFFSQETKKKQFCPGGRKRKVPRAMVTSRGAGR